jgi:hypothetical protein
MIKFEDLPTNTRALILAKLASELHGKNRPPFIVLPSNDKPT